jgi:hypothetical protein
MPAVFLKELRKAMVTKFEGMTNLTAGPTLKKINDAIDNAPDDPTNALAPAAWEIASVLAWDVQS